MYHVIHGSAKRKDSHYGTSTDVRSTAPPVELQNTGASSDSYSSLASLLPRNVNVSNIVAVLEQRAWRTAQENIPLQGGCVSVQKTPGYQIHCMYDVPLHSWKFCPRPILTWNQNRCLTCDSDNKTSCIWEFTVVCTSGTSRYTDSQSALVLVRKQN